MRNAISSSNERPINPNYRQYIPIQRGVNSNFSDPTNMFYNRNLEPETQEDDGPPLTMAQLSSVLFKEQGIYLRRSSRKFEQQRSIPMPARQPAFEPIQLPQPSPRPLLELLTAINSLNTFCSPRNAKQKGPNLPQPLQQKLSEDILSPSASTLGNGGIQIQQENSVFPDLNSIIAERELLAHNYHSNMPRSVLNEGRTVQANRQIVANPLISNVVPPSTSISTCDANINPEISGTTSSQLSVMALPTVLNENFQSSVNAANNLENLDSSSLSSSNLRIDNELILLPSSSTLTVDNSGTSSPLLSESNFVMAADSEFVAGTEVTEPSQFFPRNDQTIVPIVNPAQLEAEIQAAEESVVNDKVNLRPKNTSKTYNQETKGWLEWRAAMGLSNQPKVPEHVHLYVAWLSQQDQKIRGTIFPLFFFFFFFDYWFWEEKERKKVLMKLQLDQMCWQTAVI